MVKNKPIFSVVMPTYNAELYVGDASRASAQGRDRKAKTLKIGNALIRKICG
jgi:hypothetical protein